MPSIAITGTLGSGKSFLLDQLCKLLRDSGARVFSHNADEENRRLLAEDKGVRSEIARDLGPEFIDPQGNPDKEKLSAMICTDSRLRMTLEGIMHPRIESVWRPQAEKHLGKKDGFFVAEIPLLYEKGLERFFDRVLVIGCSDGIRKSRLASRRLIPGEQADRWLSIQQSQDQKIASADHCLWNDGTSRMLTLQLLQFLRYLTIS
jgi:dephospho-CoA kinase